MVWFRYLPSTASPSEENQDENYIYPLLKRKINISKPNQTILANSWIFVDVSDLNIDNFITNSLEQQSQQNSYLVVYEPKEIDDYQFKPVKSHIINNRLFFQTAEDHPKDININKQYSIYYKTKDLKSIKKTNNGQLEDYISCPQNEAEFITVEGDVDEAFFDVTPNTNEIYSFSFTNIDTDWDNGISLSPGASAVGTFTGPIFELYCDKGPEFGKFKIKITSLSSSATPFPVVELDWTTIDLFSDQESEDQLVFSKEDLYYKNYFFQVISDFEKNDLSKNGKINIKYYSYAYDARCTLEKEEISPFIFGRKIIGGRLNG